ncbi:MAG: hypothetical protein LUH04_11105 [Clostridium sp.]|nr:hypothetical protein [Clostridium sp.]
MGETKTTFITVNEPSSTEEPPILSIPLKEITPEGIEEEELIPEEVEKNITENPHLKTFQEAHPEYDPNESLANSGSFSTGVSFESLQHVADVLENKKTTEEDKDKAAETLIELEGSEMVQFIYAMGDSQLFIDTIIHNYLQRKALPPSPDNPEFDIENFV